MSVVQRCLYNTHILFLLTFVIQCNTIYLESEVYVMDKNKNFTITVRLNEKEMEGVKELIAYRNALQEVEGIHYSQSDIVRIALGYMYAMEITNRDMVCGYRRMFEI